MNRWTTMSLTIITSYFLLIHSQNANNPEHLVSDSDQCFANAVLYTGLSESCSLVITFLGSLNALKPGAVFSIPAAMMKRYLSSGEKKKTSLRPWQQKHFHWFSWNSVQELNFKFGGKKLYILDCCSMR